MTALLADPMGQGQKSTSHLAINADNLFIRMKI